jgi:hypothetical protein
MVKNMRRILPFVVASAVSATCAMVMSSAVLAADEGKLLFQIGAFDNNDAEFANAPDNYSAYLDSFPTDCQFVVGKSDPAKDWNYIHPGLADQWADSMEHRWEISFNVDAQPSRGQALLTLDLIGAHEAVPPILSIELNNKEIGAIETEPGTGSEYSTVEEQPGQVKTLAFPASLLKQGKNTIAINNNGDGMSWVVYDALSLTLYPGEAPK